MNALFVALPLLLTAAEDQAKSNTLTPKEIADGWILLFDGETTFGWKLDGEAKVQAGALVIGGDKESTLVTTSVFGECDLQFQYSGEAASTAKCVLGGHERGLMLKPSAPDRWVQADFTHKSKSASGSFSNLNGAEKTVAFAFRTAERKMNSAATGFRVPVGTKLELRSVKLKPRGLNFIFTGRDLTGWKEIPGHKSKFTVNDKGELNVKNGNGDLQTEEQWDDFVLQLDIISNGKHLNSGVFFRAIPGQFWSGYESQIRNQWQGDDRTKPVDYGTGGIYNRQPSRKVVSSDNEWFTKTIVAHRNHLAVWVNGYQTADFTDTRPVNKNARQGCKLDKGPISLQGHDPTTDLSFRNIRIAGLPK